MSAIQNRPNQTQRIVDLLRSRKGSWVPLPEILNLNLSKYSAPIYQARHEWGLQIETRKERINGQLHTWFRLVEKAPEQASLPVERYQTPPLFPGSRSHRSALDVSGGRA